MTELDSRNLDYIFMDLSEDLEFLDYVKRFYNHPTVPIVLVNNKQTGHCRLIGGCDSLMESFAHPERS